ncbi:MAG: hypothetical protein OEZ01_11320 [Candidatus Heimdallarchaeota archaeon]|nr:hypothetical protein [Candidatus Heimdallarchaeota archaeon]MDH5646592.1 hypothetical protein [Candidatus Heimdallarchaeota archaeon]
MSIFLYDGDKIIAFSGTYYSDDLPVRDVHTGITGVRKNYQRQGIATYLKIKTVNYYLQNHESFQYIATQNAGSNEGILKINYELGFKLDRIVEKYEGDLKGIEKLLYE